MFPHPDFELHDNAGRTTEQINAATTGAPTSEDLRRWSVKEGSVPDPVGPAITAWTDCLADAEHSEAAQLILLATTDPTASSPGYTSSSKPPPTNSSRPAPTKPPPT